MIQWSSPADVSAHPTKKAARRLPRETLAIN